MDIIKVILATLLSVAALFIITKIMGHKQVAQLDFFDYVCGITIGSIGAELATELEKPERPLIAIGIYGVVSITLNLIASKVPKARKYINGAPTILMSGGKLFRKNLKKAKLDLSEFMLLCREAGYFNLDDIGVAVFENNGKLSILPRAESRSVTVNDLGLAVKDENICAELIMDGRIMGENLTRMGRDEAWLQKELRKNGYKSPKDVFLAVYHPDDSRIAFYNGDVTFGKNEKVRKINKKGSNTKETVNETS